MGNLIRFLLPVCTPHGHVARNHLTKFPESPINPSGQADPLKAWNRKICIMQNVSIPTFVRDTVLNPRQDLLSMVSLYSRYQVVMCVHSARDTTLNIPTLRTTHITTRTPLRRLAPICTLQAISLSNSRPSRDFDL